MAQDATRFPGLLKSVQANKGLLYLVPSIAYEKAYRLFSSYLPCQFDAQMIAENMENISSVCHLLTNDISRLNYLNVLMYRLTLQTDYINRAYSAVPQYFAPAFRELDSDQVYLDCGAYIGDSFESYCAYNEEPKKAYLFEPDQENLKVLRSLSERYSATDIVIIDKGVYKETGRLYFAQGNRVSSHFTETPSEGGLAIDVTTIDASVDDEITFLKMDIEGSEKDAILGAKNSIRRSYPKLAICIYHSTSDMWEIPLMIQELFPEYGNYELYHHSNTFAETVLYVYR